MRSTLERLALRMAVLLGILTLPGCWPGVAWLPDSSGFYYTDGEHREKLMFFDLAQKKARVVVADTKAPYVVWPALRADGKEIALARVNVDNDKALVRVVFFGPDGKELRQSREFIVPKDPQAKSAKPTEVMANQLYWSTKPNKILLSITGLALVYDPAADQFVLPDTVVLATFGHSPFRPDGKGFLGYQLPKSGAKLEDLKMVAVDWDGKTQELKYKETDIAKIDAGQDMRPLFLLFAPGLHRSRWEDGAAVAEMDTLQLRLDYAKGVSTMKSIAGEKTADGKFVHDAVSLAGTKVRVQLVDLGNPKKLSFDDPKKKPEAKQPDFRLEILKEGQKPTVVREDLEQAVLLPSPDRKHVAVYCLLPTPPEQPVRGALVVIGPDGTVIANMEVAGLRKK